MVGTTGGLCSACGFFCTTRTVSNTKIARGALYRRMVAVTGRKPGLCLFKAEPLIKPECKLVCDNSQPDKTSSAPINFRSERCRSGVYCR